MKQFALRAGLLLSAVTLAACGGGSPTSPSSLPHSVVGLGGIHADDSGSGSSSNTFQNALFTPQQNFASSLANVGFALEQWAIRAEDDADRQEVRLFARELRRHFFDLQDTLESIAGGQFTHIRSFSSTNASVQQSNSQLERVSGSAFDRMFMNFTVQILSTTATGIANSGMSSDSPLGRYASGRMSDVSSLLRYAREVARIVAVPNVDTRVAARF